MASNSLKRGEIRVLIEGKDGEDDKLYRLSKETTISKLLHVWRQQSGNKSSVRFLDVDGSPLTEQLRISDVKQLRSGRVDITYEEEMEIGVIVEGDSDIVIVRAWPSQTIEEVLETFQVQIHEWEGRSNTTQLIYGEEVLDSDFRISDLECETGVRPILKLRTFLSLSFCDPWDNHEFSFDEVETKEACDLLRSALVDGMQSLQRMEQEKVLAERRTRQMERQEKIRATLERYGEYAAPALTVRETWAPDNSNDETAGGHDLDDYERIFDADCVIAPNHFIRMRLHGERIFFLGTVLELLKKFGAPWTGTFDMLLDIPRNVTVVVDQSLHRRRLCPEQPVSSVSSSAPVFAGNVRHRPDQFLCDLDLPEEGLLFVDSITVILQLASFRRHTSVTLPTIATVGDLRRRTSYETEDFFVELIYGSRSLENDDELLTDAGIRTGSVIRVEKTMFDINVIVKGHKLSWQERGKNVSYSMILDRLCSKLPIEFGQLDEVVLSCSGCGRRITKDQEQYQRVPANCCSRQSKYLEISKLPDNEGAKTQLETNVLICAVQQLYELFTKGDLRFPGKDELQNLTDIIAKVGTNYNLIIKQSDRFQRFMAQMKASVVINAKLNSDMKTLEEEMKELQSSMNRLKAKNNTVEEQFKSQRDANIRLTADNNSLEDDIKELYGSINQLHKSISIIRAEKASMERKLMDFENSLKPLHAKIGLLEDEKKKLQETIKDLQTSRDFLSAEKSQLATKFSKSNNQLIELRRAVQDFDKELKAENKKLKDIKIENAKLLDNNRTIDIRNKDLKDCMLLLNTSNAKLILENETLGVKLRDLEIDKAKLMDDNRAMDEKIKRLSDSILQLRTSNENTTLCNETLETKLKGLEKCLGQRNANYNNLRFDFLRQQEMKKELQEMVAQLEVENTTLKGSSKKQYGSLKIGKESKRDLSPVNRPQGFLNNIVHKVGATAAQILDKKHSVKFFIFYLFGIVPVVSHHLIRKQGTFPWSGDYIKCEFDVHLSQRWASFEEITAIIDPLFAGEKITVIRQLRGLVGDREVAEVTCLDTDDVEYEDVKRHFCDINGEESSWAEAGKPKELKFVRKGGRILVCGGNRRTVLVISSQ